ncbi:MAG: TlpA disulfide reductase family protein [Clostridia bacterium]|nr:TlpA disulfide reductase family protein [Clostridia bacterium]
MKRKTLIIYGMILVLLLLLAVVGYRHLSKAYQPEDSTSQQSTQTKKAAADFTVFDADGKAVKLSDFKGMPVVVNFWASWCGPCKSELPAFENVYQEFGDQVQFLMVNLTDGQQETLKDVQNFLSQNPYTFPVYYDTQLSASIAYRIQSIPRTILVDADGSLYKARTGAMSEVTLRKYLSGLLEN